MIRFWTRELAGWLLIFVGLAVLLLSVICLLSPDLELLIAAPMISVIGIVVFRGGIHLLKVAVAARICMTARTEASRPQADKSKKKADAPWDW